MVVSFLCLPKTMCECACASLPQMRCGLFLGAAWRGCKWKAGRVARASVDEITHGPIIPRPIDLPRPEGGLCLWVPPAGRSPPESKHRQVVICVAPYPFSKVLHYRSMADQRTGWMSFTSVPIRQGGVIGVSGYLESVCVYLREHSV